MSETLKIILLTTAAGGCIPLGGFLSSYENFQRKWLEREFRHFIIAFGGGILLGATALVLVPEGVEGMNNSLFAIPVILAGSLAFFYIETKLGKKHNAPQLMGMLLDFIPEAIAFGGLVAIDSPAAPLLALLIGMQNLPEGFNAYREITAISQPGKGQTLLKMLALVMIGPIAGLSGYYFLSGWPIVLGMIMLFASGGILYLIFQDIAPQSRLEKHWAPPLGAVLGFGFALFAKMIMN
jgi:ZIP family zinc transporter